MENTIKCIWCGSNDTVKKGFRSMKQRYKCKECGRYFTPKNGKRKKSFNYDENKGGACLSGNIDSSSTDRVKILDEFLELCEVDLSAWVVDRFVLNAWDVTMSGDKSHTDKDSTYTNYQIKVWLKRVEVNIINLGFEHYLERIPKFKPPGEPKFTAKSGVALEISVFDAHIGKLAWENEVGRRNYDLKQATSDYEYAVNKLLEWSIPFKPEKIFYIVGQDLLHTDNFNATTPHAGHQLDADGRLPKIFSMAFEIVTKGIYAARAVAPVDVIWIEGNHDMHTSMFLCFALREHFRDDPHVTIDLGEQSRKVRLWGNLLVGWTHEINNRQEAWANELAQAFPKEWAKSKYREWHHGHKHKKKEIKTMPIFTAGGVLCRQLTALSEIDKWHYDFLYTDAVSGGEGFLWDKENGVFCNFTTWTQGRTIKNKKHD